MNRSMLKRVSEFEWTIAPTAPMRVPGIVFASLDLIEGMDDKVLEQLCNVAALPGIVGASYAMPDAHWGYGFPIGGVAAFDADADGVISGGGVETATPAASSEGGLEMFEKWLYDNKVLSSFLALLIGLALGFGLT